jgi:hypothetical protein
MHGLDCSFLLFFPVKFAAVLAIFGLSNLVFWLYFSLIGTLAISLVKIAGEVRTPQSGFDRFTTFGRLWFAIPLAVFGAEHLADAADVAELVPRWIPGHLFWAYFVGLALVFAALSIVLKIQARLAATLLGVMFLSFVAMIHIPNIVAQPDRFFWAIGLRDLSFSGGAFALAGSQRSSGSAYGKPLLMHLGRFFIAIPALFFGVEHFLHAAYVPGVPLNKLTPAWIPGRLFLTYFTGLVLLAAGACLLANKKARWAAGTLGATILLLMLVVYLPMLIAAPTSVVAMNYFADTLMFGGAVLILADSLR